MNKKTLFNFAYILIMVITMTAISTACTSKKVKDNEYSTSFNSSGNEDISVPDEFVFEIAAVGKNMINITMSKPEFEKIYNERVIRDDEVNKGKTPSEAYTYELELRLKKGDETLYTMLVNKNGGTFTAAKKDNNGEFLQIKTGGKSNTWILNKKIIEFQLTTPGLVELIDECDNYEAYWYDKSTGDVSQLHQEGQNIISETLPRKSAGGVNTMSYSITYESDNRAFLKIQGMNLGGNEPSLILLGEDESKYILIKAITKDELFAEIETAEYFYQNGYFEENYTYSTVSFIVEFGYANYDENGERTFEPLKNSNGNTYYTAIEVLARSTYPIHIKYDNIKEFLGEKEDYSEIKGYIGEKFEELVYVVTN